MTLFEILPVLRLYRAAAVWTSPIALTLRGPILTVLLSASLGVTVLSVREGGLRPALRILFERPHTSDTMQRELRVVAQRDAVIDSLLKAILAKAPTAARVRVAIIHNGQVGLSGIGMLRFDVTHSAARPGFSPGVYVTNGPLSDWGIYLAKLLTRECTAVGLSDMSPAERSRMLDLDVMQRLACPILDLRGRLLGGLFITWPVGSTTPDEIGMRDLTEFTRRICAQIAAAMSTAATAPGGGDLPES